MSGAGGAGIWGEPEQGSPKSETPTFAQSLCFIRTETREDFILGPSPYRLPTFNSHPLPHFPESGSTSLCR